MLKIKPQKPRYRKVKSEVKKVLNENFIENPPVNVRDLVENYGLTLKFAEFPEQMDGVCGFLDTDEKAIWVNAKDKTKRQNFTIAHELGHWLLHRCEIEADPASYHVLRRQPMGGEKDYRETEANSFAANLLVPADMLKICRKAGFTNIMMSDLFGVSQDVIGYRLQQEGLDG